MLRKEYYLSENAYGKWIYTNEQKYLEVKAPDHYTLGKIEGKMLAGKIRLFQILFYLMLFPYFFLKGMTYWHIVKIVREHEQCALDKYKELYKELQDEMRGMADIIWGISYNDILIQNTYIELVYGYLIPIFRKFPAEFEIGCTSIGVRKHSSKKENYGHSQEPDKKIKIIMGQNFDYSKFFLPMASFAFIDVENRPKIFCFRLGAMLSLPAGKNENNVKLNVNTVKSRIKGKAIIATGVRTRLGWYMADSADNVKNMILETKESICYNLLIGDNNKLIALEINPYEIPQRNVDTWVALTNTFTSEILQEYLFHKDYSKERQRHAEKLLEKYYHTEFSEMDLLKKILSDKPIISRKK
ncbi:MAG: hypothetical protein GF364_04930, partial [Candidatus Lokiarchaeota archaeon]|nr:hypothetical protein [Candidatus Lokiarchaeota archaeon]